MYSADAMGRPIAGKSLAAHVEPWQCVVGTTAVVRRSLGSSPSARCLGVPVDLGGSEIPSTTGNQKGRC